MDRDLSKTSGNGRKFKRFMATLLSVAMIVLELPAMAVPTMAATKVQAASSEAVVTEAETNAVDASVDEKATEDANASETSEENLTSLDTVGNDIVDGEEELEYADDVTIQFADASAAYVSFLNPSSDGGATAIGAGATITTDSEKPFSFEIAPYEDYDLADVSSDTTTSSLVSITFTKTDNSPDAAVLNKDFVVGDLIDGKRTIKITSDYLKEYKANKKDATYLTVEAAATPYTTATYPITYTGDMKQPAATSSYFKCAMNAGLTVPLKGYFVDNKPITSVSLYYTNEKGKKVELDVTDDYTYNQTTYTLAIKAAGSTEVYNNYKATGVGLTVEAHTDEHYTIEQADAGKYATVNFKSGVSNGKIPYDLTSEQAAENVTFEIKPITTASTNRSVIASTVKYSIDGGSKVTTGLSETDGIYTLPKENITGDVIIYAPTVESVTVTTAGTNAIVSYEDAKEASKSNQNSIIFTGEDFNFNVKAANGYEVIRVDYTIGTGTSAKTGSLDATTDGSYKISGEEIKNAITLTPVTTSVIGDTNVKIGSVKCGETILSGNTGIYYPVGENTQWLSVSAKETREAINGSDQSLATAGEDFYFYVTPLKNSSKQRYNVTSVKYTNGGTTTPVKASLVKGYEDKGLYVIEDVAADGIVLSIEVEELQKITAPENSNVVMTVDGTVVKAGKSINVLAGADHDIAISPAKSNSGTVKMTSITYTANGSTSSDYITSGEVTSTVQFSLLISPDVYGANNAISTNNAVVVNALTKEYRTSGFTNTFKVAGNNAKFDEDEAGVEVSPQTLLVANKSNNTVITPEIRVNGRKQTLDGASCDYFISKTSTGTKTYTDSVISVTDGTGSTETITATAKGDSTIQYELGMAENKGNTVIFTGSLPVTVKPAVIIKEIKAVRSYVIADNSDAVQVYAEVVNGATGEQITSASGWAQTWEKTAKADDVTVTEAGIGAFEGNQFATTVKASSTAVNAIGIKLTLTKETISYKTENPVLLNIVENARYGLIPTVTLPSGYYEVNPSTLGLEASGINTASASYKVYKDTTDGSTFNFADLDSKEDVENAIKAGSITDVTSQAEIKVEALKTGSDKASDNVTVEGSGTEFTVKGTSANNSAATDLKATASINGLTVDDTVVCTVYSKLSTNKVNLVINNKNLVYKEAQGLHQKGELVTQELSKAYINNRAISVIEETQASADADATGGIQFSEITTDSAFVLPEQKDITTVDSDHVLAGWAVKTNDGSLKDDAKTVLTNNTYPADGYACIKTNTLAPGATIYVKGAIELVAIWKDKYEFGVTYRDLGNKDIDGNPDTSVPLYDADANVTKGSQIKIGTVIEENGVWSDDIDANGGFNKTTLYAPTGISYSALDCTKLYNPADYNPTNPSADNNISTTLTVLDATALKEGKVVGKADGYAYLVPTYKVGSATYTGAGIKLTVEGTAKSYKVEFKPNMPDSVAEGEEKTVSEPTIKVIKDDGTEVVFADGGIVSWTYSVADTIKVEGDINNETVITGLKATGTKDVVVTAHYKSIDGIDAEVATKNIKVTAATAKVVLTDKDGKILDNSVVEVATSSTKDRTTTNAFYVNLVNPSDNNKVLTTTGQWSAIVDVEHMADEIPVVFANTGKPVAADFKAKALAPSNGTMTIRFTADSGEVYSKDVTIKSYYPVTFNADKVLDSLSPIYTQAKNDKKVLKGDVTISEGSSTGSKNTDLVKKIFKDDLDKNNKFSFDLGNYSADYSGTDFNISFEGWAPAKVAASATTYNDSAAPSTLITKVDKAGDAVELYPVFTDLVVESIETNRSSIVLNNADTDTTKDNYQADVMPVTVYTTPEKTSAAIKVKSATGSFFQMVDGEKTASTIGDAIYTANSEVRLTDIEEDDKAVDYKFTVGSLDNKAGKATLVVYTTSGKATKSINLIVYGLYTDTLGKNLRYLQKDGTDLKNGSVTVNKKDYYFDADGNQIKNGLAKNSDGTFAFLRNGDKLYGYQEDGEGNSYYSDPTTGVITPNSVAVISGVNSYYTGADGKIVKPTIATGESYAIVGNGKDLVYLADENGKILTKAAFTALGVEAVKVSGVDYVVGDKDIAAPADRLYIVSKEWTTEWPDSFEVTKIADVKMTAKVKVHSEKKGTDEERTIEADVTYSPETVSANTALYMTAKADLSEFYTDNTYKTLATTFDSNEEYKVSADGKTAEIADRQYVKSVTFSAWPETFDTTKEPGLTATLVVYSEKQKKDLTVAITADKITYDRKDTGLGENNVIYTAKVDLSKYYTDSTYSKKAETATSSETYLVKGNIATLADKKIVTKVSSFSWTPALNKDYKKGSTVTATVTVSYKLEKAGTTGSEEISATVQEISNSNKKIVYQATVNPTGYYKADGTAYDWTKVTATKTYTVNEGGQGVSDGITVEGIEEEYYYTGVAIKPVVTVKDATADKVLVLGTDYTVKYQNNTKVGTTATVIITGKGNYDKKEVKKTFNIVDPMEGETATDYYEVKSVKYDKEDLIYDGTAKAPSKLTIATKEGVTVTATWNGSDYDIAVPDVDGAKTVRVVVANNINKGSGTIAVYGSKTDRPVKKNFSIKAADMSTLGDKITVSAEAAPYSKKGAKAEVSVTYENGAGETVDLVEGRDFTVKYGYTNKKNAGEKAGTVTITGKNNFSKKATTIASFDIEKLEISESNIIVDAYEKVAPKSLKVKVFDEEGEEVSNKYYSITKITKGDEDITNSKDKLAVGDEIYVTVKGDGVNLADDEVELEVKVGTKLASAKFNAKNLTKTYEGTPIELDDSDLEKVAVTVKINKVETTLVAGEDYEIVGYKNNNKKGNMTVFVKGIGDKVSGYAKFTVKVNAKKLEEAK